MKQLGLSPEPPVELIPQKTSHQFVEVSCYMGSYETIRYLTEQIEKQPNNADLIDKALLVYRLFRMAGGCNIAEPNVEVSDCTVLFTWDNEEYHLELEIESETKHPEFFYKNRRTEEMFLDQYKLAYGIPASVMEKFKYFKMACAMILMGVM